MTSTQISHDKLNITHFFLGCVFLNPTPAFGPFPNKLPPSNWTFPLSNTRGAIGFSTNCVLPMGITFIISEPTTVHQNGKQSDPGQNRSTGKNRWGIYICYIYVTCIHLVCSYRHNNYIIYILYTKELTLQTGTRTRFQQRLFELLKYCFQNAMWCYSSVKLPQWQIFV